MTLDELYAIDPMAKWASLSPEAQASIIVPLLTSAFAEVCQDDDGTDCSSAEKEEAGCLCQRSHQDVYDALGAAFHDILADDHTALHDFDPDMLDGAGKIRVRDLRGPRQLRTGPRYHGHHIRLGGRMVEIGGFRNIGTREAPAWEAWTQAQVDDERVRRHPEQFVGPRRSVAPLSFHSVLGPTQSASGSPPAAHGSAMREIAA